MNVLNLSAVYDTGFLDDASAVVVAFFLFLSAVSLFRDIRKLTDVESSHKKGMHIPHHESASDKYVRIKIADK